MRDCWVYTDEEAPTTDTSRLLAELGYRSLRVGTDGALRPPDGSDNGTAVRRPQLAVVIHAADVCDRLRADPDLGEVPVLLILHPAAVPAAVPEVDEILVEPFTVSELELRVGRAQRLRTGVEDGSVVRWGTLEVNLDTYQVTVGGDPIDFAFVEYELLKFFVTHPGRVFSRESLLTAVWGYDYYGGSRTVDVHVRRLRAKLGTENAWRLGTVRGVGYRFDA